MHGRQPTRSTTDTEPDAPSAVDEGPAEPGAGIASVAAGETTEPEASGA